MTRNFVRLSPVLCALVAVPLLAGACTALAAASPFTPLEWQRPVPPSMARLFPGQRKFTTWIRDKNRNAIDDEIERRFKPGSRVNVIVDLNRCLNESESTKLLRTFGRVRYAGKLLTYVVVDGVPFDRLPQLAALPDVAMVEWQVPYVPFDDISGRAVQAEKSATFSPQTARDAGLTGSGVTIAIVDTGVNTNHEAFAGKFVTGFDATTMTVGTTVDSIGHGTHVAGIALGLGTPGRVCRAPGAGNTPNCAGIAPAAKLVPVKVCGTSSCPNAAIAAGLDWLGINAQANNIRVANMSLGACVADDGNSAFPQQVNYIVALGVFFSVSHGNAANCSLAPGSVLTGPPGSASFAATVAGSNDAGTIPRTNDTIFSSFLRGPRIDFNPGSPNLQALKPDIAAPGEGIFSANVANLIGYVSLTGTSMAAPHVAGAGALLIQAKPSIDPSSLKDALMRSADTSHNVPQFPAVSPAWDRQFGAGILDLWQAVNIVTPTDVGFPQCSGPAATPGGLCTLSGGLPVWNNYVDITTTTPPQVGVQTTIQAKVRNYGTISASVLVNFGVYEFAVGNNQFFHVGTVPVTIPPNTTVTVSQPWTPDAVTHQCVQVAIQFGQDSNYGNNLTQRNMQVSPSVYNVRVETPFMVETKFRLAAKSDRPGWICRISDTAFSLKPFECPRMVRVTFNAPPGTAPGERANCDLAVYALAFGKERYQLIGGVTMQTYVPRKGAPGGAPGRGG